MLTSSLVPSITLLCLIPLAPPLVDGNEIVAAYLGGINVPSQALQQVSGCNPQAFIFADGMPLTLDVAVNPNTLRTSQFLIHREKGRPREPRCATLAPADGPDEGYTILLTGNFASNQNLPTRVEIVEGDDAPLLSIDGEDLTGLSIDTVILGSESGVSLALAFAFSGTGPNGQDQIQTVWQGGVTADQGAELSEVDLPGFWLVDADGGRWNPDGFDDLNDGDNFLVLNVPSLATQPIVRVEVSAYTVFDPLNFPNPFTTVDIENGFVV